MTWLYNVFIRLYILGIRVASLRNEKARQWIEGRKNLFEELQAKISASDKTIWFHCASAGELEQGKPLIEALKKEYPSHKLVISFFSPSGFQVAKKYSHADVLTYLPADTKKNARKFIALVHPELAIFVKYEYWYHHLSVIAFHHIPALLISSIFREKQVFFKWYGKFFRQMLFLFRKIFVQDEESLQLLKKAAVDHCAVGGDTRFDRVVKIAASFEPIETIALFKAEHKLIVAGSTWPGDEDLFVSYANQSAGKFIFAPHELKKDHLDSLLTQFNDSVLYSHYVNGKQPGARVLIIDNIGMLSRIYHYADICYIGGGFNKSGIHNTLEAAVYGRPVIFGPNYQKFREARELVSIGGAFSISNREELKAKLDQLMNDQVYLEKTGQASKIYVHENKGATQKILDHIQAKRLLTR